MEDSNGYLRHFVADFLIAIIFVMLMYHLFIKETSSDFWTSVTLGVAIGFVAGIAKEMYDFVIRKARFSFSDVIFTICGGLAGGIMIGIGFIV